MVVAMCDPGAATAEPTSRRLPQVEFSAATVGWSAFIAYDGSWKKRMLAVLLVRIRLIEVLGWMLGGAGDGTRRYRISNVYTSI